MKYRAELEHIIRSFGSKWQDMKAIEEMSELQKELCKDLGGQGNTDHIIEEIADVQIMLNQLMIIYGIQEAELEKRMLEKIKRTYTVIEKRGNAHVSQ